MTSSGEFALIESLKPYLAGPSARTPVPAGDDAAVVDVGGVPVAFAIDALVADVHFDEAISSPEDIGWKALAVNVSDIAAMGGATQAAVVALQRPPALDDDLVHRLYGGMREASDRFGVDLVGGDVVRGPALALSVAVIGTVLSGGPLRRADASPGEVVVVIGALGLAAAGLAARRAGQEAVLDAHPELLAAHRRPEPLADAAAPLCRAGASACIDVSDGLGRDLSHVADASGVRIEVRAADVPVPPGVAAAASALSTDVMDLVCGGGEDFALAATIAPDRFQALEAGTRAVGLPLTPVGRVVSGDGVALLHEDGREQDITTLGYEHA